jgi:hypothetical protein
LRLTLPFGIVENDDTHDERLMSIALVKAEIAKFLGRSEPEVLCLRGRWGVGKTHAWNSEFNAARTRNSLGLKNYAYVSLFGINSLEALKFAILENTQNMEIKETAVSLGKLPGHVAKMLANSPLLAKFVDRETIQGVLFSSISKQLICLDDFERRSDNLRAKDALGLISSLKEARACKVALILNEERLEETARVEFETHLEKVVDISLLFDPSASQAAEIGVTRSDQASSYVRDRSIALGITNIRTIARCQRFVESIKPLLAGHDPEVLRNAIRGLVLFCWCRDAPEDAPPLNFIEEMRADTIGLDFGDEEKNSDSKEARWTAKLHAYGYMWTDDFDTVLIESVRKG